MRIDPKQPNLLPLPPVKFRDARYRSRRHRMIPSQHQRNLPRLQRLQNKVRALHAGRGNFLKIFCAGRAFFFLFRNRNRNIARVLDHMSDRLQPSLQPSHAHRRRTHIHATARLSKVKRNANNPNLSRIDAAERSSAQRHIQFFSSQNPSLCRIGQLQLPHFNVAALSATRNLRAWNPRLVAQQFGEGAGKQRLNLLGHPFIQNHVRK